MWSTSSTGQSEGGFMDESYATTSALPKEDKDSNRSSNIIPMMIGHLVNCSPESKTTWDSNIRFICIVGIVRKISQATTKITYNLEDETGMITAFKWLEAESPPPEDIVEDQYVRVHGSVRIQDKRTHVFVLKIAPITNYAEVFSHLLEVVHMVTKMKQQSVQSAGDGNANDDDNDETCHSLTTEQKTIYKMIKSTNNKDTGIERSELKAQVPSNLLPKVDAILEFLASEGHIYTTCTDDHFLAT